MERSSASDINRKSNIVNDVTAMNKPVLVFFTISCLLSVALLAKLQMPSKASANVIDVPADYQTIQEAVDAANDEDTVYVHNGAYRERLIIEKAVLLIGENRQTTMIDGAIDICSSGVLLSNFTVRGYTEGAGAIFIRFSNTTLKNNIIWGMNSAISMSESCKNSSITGNDIIYSRLGIWARGSSHNFIDNNRIIYNERGIWMEECTYNTISNNEIANSSASADPSFTVGIWMDSSHNNKVTNNKISNNSVPLGLRWSFDNDIVGNNITDNDSFGVSMLQCSNCSVVDNYIVNNGGGISLEWASNSSRIVGNNIRDNDFGITVDEQSNGNEIMYNDLDDNNGCGVSLTSAENTIVGNRISNHTVGIRLFNSSDNTIYHNFLLNNTNQAQYINQSYPNVWDNGYPSGGNYWSDYNETDVFAGPFQNETGSDGIGDVPYFIDSNNIDNYPLTNSPDLYLQLLREFDTLNITYYSLLDDYGKVQTDLNSLNSTYQNLKTDYETLSSAYIELQSNYTTLNATYAAVLAELDQLYLNYSSLDSVFNHLNTTYNNLAQNYGSLQTSYNQLNFSYIQLQDSYAQLQSDREAVINELDSVRNLMYIFIAFTIIATAAALHLSVKKNKATTQKQ
jgi:parallel beta-helix repeat protein